jgi:hypothetical protein
MKRKDYDRMMKRRAESELKRSASNIPLDAMDCSTIFLVNAELQRELITEGFWVDAKQVGNALDEIFSVMEARGIEIIPELMELKQYLRFKGNSLREHGDFRYWTHKEADLDGDGK